VIQDLINDFNTIKEKLKSSWAQAKNPQAPSADDSQHFLKYVNYGANDDTTKLKYEYIVEKLSKYHAIISKINKFTQINKKHDEFMSNLNKHLKKNPTFALILAWRTSNVPKCNLWVQYVNILNPNWAYINDKNIFLYELTNLGDDEKEKICKVYLDLFNKINIPANVAGNAALQAKTQQNVLSFCLEVFVNLGPFVKDNGKSGLIKAAIDEYLSSQQTLPEPAAPDASRVETTEPIVFKPNRFAEVIAELNALNNTKKVNEGMNTEHTEIIVKIPPGDASNTYDPVLTPMLIEELIEIKVNSDNPQAIEDKQDITGVDALDDLRLDVTADANNELSPNPEKRDLTFGEENPDISKIKGVEFKDTNQEAFSAAPAAPADDKPVLQPDIQEGGQIGGRAIRYQNISFIFDNKMAPRYLATTNLFLTRQNKEVFDYILNRLIGASEIMINELTPRNPEQLGETDLTIEDLRDISRPAAPDGLEQSYVNALNGVQIGGTHEEIDSLISSVESILKNEKIASHPLLSIYLILESYCTELEVTYIKDSWDYEIFVQFFIIINEMINNLLKIYSDDKNTNINKLKACMVGYGLRELIFTSPQYIERDPICKNALSLNDDTSNYNQLSKMFSILVNRVCGSVNQTQEDIELGSKYISSPIFKEYADGINFRDILNSDVPDVDTYQLSLKSNALFLAVGRKIISDTNGIENNELLGLTENNVLPLETILSQPLSSEISSQDISVNEDSKSNALSNMLDPTGAYERKKNIEKMKAEGTFVPSKFTSQLPKYDNRETHSIFDSKNNEKPKIEDNAGIQYVTSSSSNGSTKSSNGGKKTRKHRRHLKNRRTKRNNRTKRRITRKNKRVRKNNKSRR
jgi:hypothetical protein